MLPYIFVIFCICASSNAQGKYDFLTVYFYFIHSFVELST